ncbi:MAG: MATE family efflux transporter [Acidimicrobiia bacterium]|nr:MATE family efflux transporter [Acidimicrobiia bacterium]
MSPPTPTNPASTRRRWDREIFRLAIPAFGALVAEPAYVLVDTAIVGHLGTPQLAGLALAGQLLLSVYALFIFLAYGTTAAVARLLGAGRAADAARWGVQALLLALVAGVAAGGLLYGLSDPLLRLLGGEGEVLVQARIYLHISLAGLPALLLMLAGVGYLRGGLDMARPLKVAALTAAGNLVLEVILVYGLGFGIGASALSTVVAQWVGAALFVRWVLQEARPHVSGLRPDPAVLRRLVATGGSLLARTAALQGAFVAATAVAARTGVADLAAHQVNAQLFAFSALALDALAIAAQGMVGTKLGAGDGAGARGVSRRVTWWGLVFGLVAALVALGLRPVLPQLFSNDPAVVALAGFLMLHLALMLPINGVVFALDGVLIGAGDLRYLAGAMGAAAAVFVPLAVGVRLADAGIGWLWGALVVFMAARLAGVLVRFIGSRWVRVGGH